MFKPKFLKEAQMLQKGVRKFLRYKRDLISPADLDEIAALCERHGLRLIEDCAQAHGGRWRDQVLDRPAVRKAMDMKIV